MGSRALIKGSLEGFQYRHWVFALNITIGFEAGNKKHAIFWQTKAFALRYNPGLFLNALRPDSAWRNENTWIGLEEDSPPKTVSLVLLDATTGAELATIERIENAISL